MKYLIGIIAVIIALFFGGFINEQLETDACRVFDMTELVLTIGGVVMYVIFLGIMLYGFYQKAKLTPISMPTKEDIKGMGNAVKSAFTKENLKGAFTRSNMWETAKVLAFGIVVMAIMFGIMFGIIFGIHIGYMYIK